MGADVVVMGAGSWGTTVAALMAVNRPVKLWARSAELADAIRRTRVNERYLPGAHLPPSVDVAASVVDAVSDAGVVLMAVPSHGLRGVLHKMAAVLDEGAAVVSLAKGIEAGTGLRMSEVIGEVLPGHPTGVLSGPNLAHEVASGQPAAALVASADEGLAQRVQSLLHGANFRVYTGADVVGCEIAGASKNVIAIAVGISDGFGFGENTRALLITRGLAEQARLGIALGGNPLTFGGLAGVGDLVATCTSAQSRNRSVGVELGRGRHLDDVVAGMVEVAEGIRTAGPMVELAHAHGVEMPIASRVAALVAGETSPAEAVASLMERPPGPEWDSELMRTITA